MFDWVLNTLPQAVYIFSYTVKPVYSGHHRGLKIVSVIERCPLHRGSSQIVLHQKPTLGCFPKCVKRPVMGEEPKDNMLKDIMFL